MKSHKFDRPKLIWIKPKGENVLSPYNRIIEVIEDYEESSGKKYLLLKSHSRSQPFKFPSEDIDRWEPG